MVWVKLPQMSVGDVIEWGSIIGSVKSEIRLKKVNSKTFSMTLVKILIFVK